MHQGLVEQQRSSGQPAGGSGEQAEKERLGGECRVRRAECRERSIDVPSTGREGCLAVAVGFRRRELVACSRSSMRCSSSCRTGGGAESTKRPPLQAGARPPGSGASWMKGGEREVTRSGWALPRPGFPGLGPRAVGPEWRFRLFAGPWQLRWRRTRPRPWRSCGEPSDVPGGAGGGVGSLVPFLAQRASLSDRSAILSDQ